MNWPENLVTPPTNGGKNVNNVFLKTKANYTKLQQPTTNRCWFELVWLQIQTRTQRKVWKNDFSLRAPRHPSRSDETPPRVRQGCLLSHTLFNIFLERIMCKALDDHEGSLSIGGRLITKFRFADDIVVNVEEEEEAGVLIDRLDTTTIRYKMAISPEKIEGMTNNTNGFQRETKINGQRIEEVENFKYLGAIISNEGSNPEILSRIAQTTVALSRLKITWRDKKILPASKFKLMRTLVLSAFLYVCESWTLTAEIERRIQAFEMRCYRRLLNISYKDHVTNEEVCNRIQNAIGVHDDLLTMVKKRKLKLSGHISRASGMAKTLLQGTVKRSRGEEDKKRWDDNINEWTGKGFGYSLKAAEDREGKVLLQRHRWCPDDLQG